MAFSSPDEESFVREVLSGQPDPPPYFARMKQVNKEGPSLLGDRLPPAWLGPEELPRILEASELVIDTRPADEFAAGYVAGTINVQAIRTFITWAGWLCPYDRPFTVIVRDEEVQATVDRNLSLIGLEGNVRYLTSDAVRDLRELGWPLETIPRLDSATAASTLGDSKRPFLLDVRQSAEWNASRIADSVNIFRPIGSSGGACLRDSAGRAHHDRLPCGQPLGHRRQHPEGARIRSRQRCTRRHYGLESGWGCRLKYSDQH